MTDLPQRSVEVFRNSLPLSYINRHGEEIPLGHAYNDRFAGENVTKLMFAPGTENPFARNTEKTYELGTGSRNLSLVNPADIMRVLLNQGWQIRDQFGSYGGAIIETHFTSARAYGDTITYDVGFWNQHGRIDSELRPMIRLVTNLYPGHMAASLEAGIWRKICTNGAVANIMKMPKFQYRHATWSVRSVLEDLATSKLDSFVDGVPSGPVVTSIKNLRKAYMIIADYKLMRDNDNLSPEIQNLAQVISMFKPNVVKQNWLMTNYLNQLALFAFHPDVSEDMPVYALYLVNILTSAINVRRISDPRGAMAAYALVNPIVDATAMLCGLAALFETSNPEPHVFEEVSDRIIVKRVKRGSVNVEMLPASTSAGQLTITGEDLEDQSETEVI